MELTDILSKEEWALFEKELYDRFHINCTVYNTSGIGVTVKPNWCNRLCPQIKANKDSLAAICAPGNQNFMAQAKQTQKAVIGECDAGLMKICVPIFSNGNFLGTAGGCGLLPQGGEVETFMIEKTTGLSEEEIAALCEGMNSMTQGQAGEMADFIEERIAEFKTQKFINDWVDDRLCIKTIFISLLQDLQQKENVAIEFHERPGISFSLRGVHKNQKDRPLFVMIDIIDDDPKQRWLSICFYGDTIADPDDQGDLVPEGLLGSDGYCFNLTDSDESLKEYVGQRIQEAYEHACKGGN
jgi:ligand-binding sensor protein